MKKIWLIMTIVALASNLVAQEDYKKAILELSTGSDVEVLVLNMTSDTVIIYQVNVMNDYRYSVPIKYPANKVNSVLFEDGRLYKNHRGKLFTDEEWTQMDKKERKVEKSSAKELTSVHDSSENPNGVEIYSLIPEEAISANPNEMVLKGGRYYLNGEWLATTEYEKVLRLNSQTSYAYYKSAKTLRDVGIGVFSAGVAEALLISVPCSVVGGETSEGSSDGKVSAAGTTFVVIGTASIVAGAVCWGVGAMRIKKTVPLYNAMTRKKGSTPTLSFNAGVNAIGCSVEF